ncbi:hypothetical protein MASR2M74_33070 [Paracoccaceae bacterium]
MDCSLRRPLAAPPCSVAPYPPHQMLVCTVCRHSGTACAPGLVLLDRLRRAIATAAPGEAFEISGTACLTGCTAAGGTGCTVGWRATAKATWFFGDIDPDQPIEVLIAFAQLQEVHDGGGLKRPAAVIVTREGPLQ